MYPLICIIVISSFSYGCATIVRGTTEPVRFTSEPPGAMVSVGGGQSCETPCTLTFKRNASLLAQYVRDGYENGTVSVYPTMSGAGIIIGGALDHALGSTNTLQPNPAHLVMRCGLAAKEATIDPTQTRLNQLNELREQGYLTPEEYKEKRAEILGQL